MKRPLVVTAALSLATVLLIAAPGDAQTPINIVRGIPLQVTATTTPARDRILPHTFTTKGRVVPPAGYCTPGSYPTPGTGNCVPIICPPGATNIKYCFVPGSQLICTGVVTVRFQKRGTTISSRNVNVARNCTYRSKVTFRTRLRTRVGVLSVRARFQGNIILAPKNSSTKTVRAG